MPTISELVKQHSKVPGDIRVYDKEHPVDGWFRPYYLSDDTGDWRGISSVSGDDIYDNYRDYELYTEPKPKVKRWLWARNEQIIEDQSRWITHQRFMTEEESKEFFIGEQRPLVRLEWSMQEFEE